MKPKKTCKVTLNLSPESIDRIKKSDAIQLKLISTDGNFQDSIWVYTDKFLSYFDIE